MTTNWQSNCSLTALTERANLYHTIRTFFAQKGVLEVETPLLSSAAATDVHLSSVSATRHLYGQIQTHYLQTSPEFAMKRLVANGSGAIYQICKVFRDDEHGHKHNSEFTMLEWYRPHFSLDDLMQETAELVNACLGQNLTFEQKSYKGVFLEKLNINPMTADCQTLKYITQNLGLTLDLGDDRLAYLDLIFSHAIEPYLGVDKPLFLKDFPAELASLAKTHSDSDGDVVASRFELYIDGVELANAYDELADADVLRARMVADNAERAALGKGAMPIDEHLLTALPKLPPCAGIALGVDRLLMIKMGTRHIGDVVSFLADRA
ncbi:MAG: EF-P lysine aminoacylase EpmA [Moraxella sp.]|nr:EF-P lysine aminoacylase EpmA [Moraxella sp.]